MCVTRLEWTIRKKCYTEKETYEEPIERDKELPKISVNFQKQRTPQVPQPLCNAWCNLSALLSLTTHTHTNGHTVSCGEQICACRWINVKLTLEVSSYIGSNLRFTGEPYITLHSLLIRWPVNVKPGLNPWGTFLAKSETLISFADTDDAVLLCTASVCICFLKVGNSGFRSAIIWNAD